MAVIVQKYGGTSVGDAERILAVARRVARSRLAGNDLVVVVSAMGHTTDQFVDLSRQVSPNDHPREMDMLLTAGERISMALLAMAIRDLGVEAVSLTGSQAGIITSTVHGRAEIEEVRAFRVKEHLDKGDVVIVAGFQGVSATSKEITTLGRGGSDATAVAMASYLQADACEIYTDVDGVFTADPRIVPEARKLDEVWFEEMAELAAAGAGVLMLRSVEMGRRWGVPLHVRSSFHDGEGTWVREGTGGRAGLAGVAHDADQALVGLAGGTDVGAVLSALEAAGIGTGTIGTGPAGVGAGVRRDQAATAAAALAALAADEGLGAVTLEEEVGKVSVVGAALRARPEAEGEMAGALGRGSIKVLLTASSPLRISCLVPGARLDEAVRLLHLAFFSPESEEAS
ncbi:MAG: aspartate kinase [Actinomycetota bacterium]